MEYNELSRQELIGYLMDFVEGLEQHSLDADEQGFVELHKKIICCPDQEAASKLAEYDTQYFSSLKEAKRELHRRMKRLQKQSVLALPEEIRPVLMLLSEVITEPSVLEETAPSQTAPKHGKVISFTDIQPNS